MQIIATIQARYASKRFPGKVLKKIGNKTILQILIERLKRSKYIKKIYVSTSKNISNIKLINYLKKKKINYYAGSENNVLDRVSQTLSIAKADVHVECFGDSPFLDIDILDKNIDYFLKNKFDVVTNTLKTTYPPGNEFLIYKANLLLDVNKVVKKSDKLREHVGYNILRFKKKYKIRNIIAPRKYFYPNIHLEIDEPVDLSFLKKIYLGVTKKKNYFTLSDIIVFLKKNTNLENMNLSVHRRWKKFRNEKL